MIYVLLSLALGLGAWACPLIGLCRSNEIKRLNKKAAYIPIISFGLCLLSIYTQIMLMKSYDEQWPLIIDALDALDFVIPILAVITILLNVLHIKKYQITQSD